MSLAQEAHEHRAHPAGAGVSFRSSPIDGELAFVFTAGGAAYHGMGTQLLRALPELATPISTNFPLGDIATWIFDIYLRERLNGISPNGAWTVTENAIRATDEWRSKH